MAKYLIEDHKKFTNNCNFGEYTVVDTEKAKRKWIEDENTIHARGLYLSSKGRYYELVSRAVKFVSQSYAAAYLLSRDLELPENLKELEREIVE
jgi:hypothetical protein